MTVNDYRERLRNLIFDKENGLIIDACEHRDADGVLTNRPELRFYLPATEPGQAGICRRYYVTLSGLFRGREYLNECLNALADAVRKFAVDGQKIDYLVSCGATGKYLIEYLLPRLQQADPSKTSTLYLGSYPHCDEGSLENLAGKRCLIVTDVIATGTWVRKISQRLSDAHAEVLGCVGVVDTTDADGSEGTRRVDQRISIPLECLTNLSLLDLDPTEHDPSTLIEVTPGTILNSLIADVRNNMLLGPQVSRNEDGSLAFSEKILFRRVSGGYQRHFVTLWPLFEKLLCFEDLMNHLADYARRLRNHSDTYFSTIVTCTATGHHLLEHLQPRIETSESLVEAVYLGPYPYHALTKLQENEFKNKSVLILTDVVASMTLVRNIASVVHRLGGEVSAVLSVVTTLSKGEQLEAEMEYAPNCSAKIESLCFFDVQKVTELPPGFTTVDIDPETILPREKPAPAVGYLLELEPRAFKPFDFATTLEHLDQSGALRMGIFEANGRYFTAGVRLPKLFELFGREIWERMKAALKDQDLLVTTTDRDDLRFLDFVQRWVESEYPGLKQLLIPRYDSLEFDFPYFLPQTARTALVDKRVVVLIYSAQISEKLRRLISLLAQSPVQSVDVICLLNRMGDHSADFVARIKQMTSGIGPQRRDQPHRFSFHWIYMLEDLHGHELVETLESIQHLADVYTKDSLSPVFRSLFSEEMRYFRVQSFLNRTIENEPGIKLFQPTRLSVKGHEIVLKSFDALLYAWFAQDRSLPERNLQIRRMLVNQTDRSSTYMVLLMILSEISFLRSQKQVTEIKTEITTAISSKRRQRLDLEQKDEADGNDEVTFQEIADLVLEETALLFSYALICYLDSLPETPETLVDLATTLTSGLSDEEWKSYPLNFQAYYGDSRTLWCVSLLLFFAHLERALTNEDFGKKCRELIALSHRFETMIAEDHIEFKPFFPEDPKTLKRRLAYPFDALLMDLGEHALDSRDRVLIFLHNRVGQSSHHNALCKDVKEALTILTDTRRVAAGPVQLSPKHAVALPQFGDRARRWKAAVDKATEAVAILTLVGEAASELFDWYRLAAKQDEDRFRNPKEKGGFKADVDFLRTLLSVIRRDSRVSAADLTLLIAAYDRIEYDLAVRQFKSSVASDEFLSPLRSAIDYYEPNLTIKIIEEMRSADLRLMNECGDIWARKAKEFEDDRNDCFVLADPLLLQEILWNLFTNVRYGLPTLGNGGNTSENSARVGCSISFSGETTAGTRARVHVEVISPANSLSGKPTKTNTWFRHEQEIKRYGGELKYRESPTIVTASLDLIKME
jgi:orotate phosphoribosyltransferase